MPINPEILKKSRDYLELSIKEVSVFLEYAESSVEKWERGSKEPTYNQLLNIAKTYQQNPHVFYLDEFRPTSFDNDFRIQRGQKIENNYYLKKELLYNKRCIDIFDFLNNDINQIKPSPRNKKDLIAFIQKEISFEEQKRKKRSFLNSY